MPSDLPRFTFRTSRIALEKLRYIADNNFRTVNKELEMLVLRYIKEFEASHGEIEVEEED